MIEGGRDAARSGNVAPALAVTAGAGNPRAEALARGAHRRRIGGLAALLGSIGCVALAPVNLFVAAGCFGALCSTRPGPGGERGPARR